MAMNYFFKTKAMRQLIYFNMMLCVFLLQGCGIISLSADAVNPHRHDESWDRMIEFRNKKIQETKNYIGLRKDDIVASIGNEFKVFYDWRYSDGIIYDEAWLYYRLREKDEYNKWQGYALRIYFLNDIVGNVEVL